MGWNVQQRREKPSTAMILSALDQAGFRCTYPRFVIAEQVALMGRDNLNFSIEELWQRVRIEQPGIGRMTMFRTIELLVRLGMVDRITFANGTERYYVGCGTHQYVTCEQCHKIVELNPPAVSSQMLEYLAHQSGFVLSGHRLELFGCCPHCQKN